MDKISGYKLPEITLLFWITKICATTLGETGGDLFSMTMNIGYALSSIILIGVFFILLFAQLRAKTFNPFLYWSVILATSTAGTTMSDYMDRTLGLGYANGSAILIAILLSIFAFWKLSGYSFSVTNIKTLKAEILYWTAILFSNTLGTALGDYLADDSGLGFGLSALLISALIGITIICHFYTRISGVVLFWVAFVLTRPFGATFGDLMTKPIEHGGFNLGTIGSSAVLSIMLISSVIFAMKSYNKKL